MASAKGKCASAQALHSLQFLGWVAGVSIISCTNHVSQILYPAH